MVRRGMVASLGALLALTGCTGGSGGTSSAPTTPTPAATSPAISAGTPSAATSSGPSVPSGLPRYAHVVVVVLENHAFGEIVGAGDAPFFNSLVASGALLTQSYAVAHPSEPNYLALFSGSTHGLSDDSCPHTYSGPNLGTALLAAGQSFVGYSEDLPSVGYAGCSSGAYARKHNPWVNFPALPARVNQPMSAFPADYASLPSVAFVVPNLDHDMHDGSVAQGDRWLRDHLSGYAAWARTHDSLLVVTADEDDRSASNRIATILAGAHLRPGTYGQHVDHYGLLRTMLDLFRLPPFAQAAHAHPITSAWTD